MGQSPHTHTAPSSSSGPSNSDSSLSSSSTVTGLNLVRRCPQYRDGVQEGAGRVEHFVIIGTDVSIARCLHALCFIVLSRLVLSHGLRVVFVALYRILLYRILLYHVAAHDTTQPSLLFGVNNVHAYVSSE